MTAQLAEFVDAVSESVKSRGPDARRRLADWCASFEEAQREGDDATATLLLDALIAFNAWLTSVNDHRNSPVVITGIPQL